MKIFYVSGAFINHSSYWDLLLFLFCTYKKMVRQVSSKEYESRILSSSQKLKFSPSFLSNYVLSFYNKYFIAPSLP